MKKKELSSLIVMIFALTGCGGSGGDSIATPTTGATSAIADSAASNPADSSQFLMEAYQDGLQEIQLSQLALQKTTNADVKSFAQRMIDDHTAINNGIMQLAQSKNISLPTTVSAAQKAQADKLSTLSGDEFDLAYMANSVDSHRKDVAAAMQQAQVGNDADVKMLADVNLPILQTHLTLAEDIDSVLDPSAFLVGAYQDGLTEIRLSQLALQTSTDNEVKQFAQRMIDDHTQVNNRITTLAQQKNINLPTTLTPERQAVLDELTKFSGVDFDKTYMDRNVVIHTQDVRQASRQSEQGRDADVKNFAQQTLPVLTSHLTMANDIDSRIEPSFLYKAFQDGMAEVQLANLALLRSSNSDVRAFAQQMIADHTKVNAQIMQLAQQRNVPLPIQASAQQSQDFMDLSDKSGAEFDQQYIDINVKNHETDVAELTTEAASTTDPDLKNFAQNTLPLLSTHLTRARELLQQLNAST